MLKYINIYIWQAVSILFNFAAVFVVTPFISAKPNLYGIYSIIIAAYFFISYADFGFLSAGMKYAAECFAQNKQQDEIQIIGFTGVVFLAFSSLYALGVLVVSFDPTLLVNGITNTIEIEVAQKMLVILALSCPALVIQRVIQIVFAIRLKDYKFQRILIISNSVKLLSAFFFFSNGRYMIVEYFLFSQLCLVAAVVVGLIVMKKSLKYDLLGLFNAFRFSKNMYNKTKKLAFTSIFLTICWILYYELDTFAIAKIFGANSVAIYAIGLTIITYFRSLFGVIFTPFIARFNHFVGLKDKEGLKLFFIKVVVLFLPLTVFPVVTVFFTVDNFILTWVGDKYISSISIASILVLTYVFSFITYPSGILIMANERVKALYFTSALQPIIFWIGIVLTKHFLGLESFAYFKFLAIFLETIVYSVIVLHFLEVKVFKLIKQIFIPTILPLSIIILLLFIVKPYLPTTIGKLNLIYYFISIGIINLIGFVLYYFTSQVFKEYSNKLIVNIVQRIKPSKYKT
jgi:O-antigen/teichoic acid export membrane protein